MTKHNYFTETYDKQHIHFGGIIHFSDFNTDYRGKDNLNGSTIASRIASDLNWEQKMIKKRSNDYKYKNGGHKNA